MEEKEESVERRAGGMQGGGERWKGGLWERDAWRLEVEAAWDLPH